MMGGWVLSGPGSPVLGSSLAASGMAFCIMSVMQTRGPWVPRGPAERDMGSRLSPSFFRRPSMCDWNVTGM